MQRLCAGQRSGSVFTLAHPGERAQYVGTVRVFAVLLVLYYRVALKAAPVVRVVAVCHLCTLQAGPG